MSGSGKKFKINNLIKNFGQLVQSSPLRELALEVAEAGLAAINTEAVIKSQVSFDGRTITIQERSFVLAPEAKLIVVAIGKCANAAALALEEILGERITGGVAIDLVCDERLKKIKSCEGDHPFPSERNIDATGQLIRELASLKEKDLVLAVISGGGSTLLCQPGNFTCLEETDLLKQLFAAGAAIQQINTVRKHLSLARGGHLARYAYPAIVVSLVFSDVPGNDLGFVASGPTVLDQSTKVEAAAILSKYGLGSDATGNFSSEHLLETPKEQKYFDRVSNLLLVSNQLALEAMATVGESLGYRPQICTSCLAGEARQMGREIARAITAAAAGTLLLYGGETTVVLRGSGRGGRNQELVLAALSHLDQRTLVASLASDGVDNSDHAGGLCDTITKHRAAELDLDPDFFLNSNNSYDFFRQTGDYFLIGPTGSNVSDLVFAVKDK